MVMAALVAPLGVWGCAPSRAMLAPVVTSDGVRFTFVHASARTVAVAGTFNEWLVDAHLLQREPSGNRWTTVVRLPLGEHAFMFVVDAREWISPPVADDYVDDGFGARNGIVVVRASK
jgi:1,4-alpha-glucan branching enzyme